MAAPLTVSQLNADAGGKVELTAANTVSIISGRARDPAGFVLNNTGFLSVGTVDGVAGIQSGNGASPAPVWLSASGGGINQSAAVTGSLLHLAAGADIQLNNLGNNVTAIDAAASPTSGSISLVNGNTGTTLLTASGGGVFSYRGSGLVTVQSVTGASAWTGSDFMGSAAINIEAPSIGAGTGLNIDATASGSVFVNATNGSIGTSGAPLAVNTGGTVWAHADAAGGNVYLASPTPSLLVGDLTAAGAGSIKGTAATPGMLSLANASTGGTLDWSGFASTTLGSGGGTISAGGPITSGNSVDLAGTLVPGGCRRHQHHECHGQLQRAGQLHDEVRLQWNQPRQPSTSAAP